MGGAKKAKKEPVKAESEDGAAEEEFVEKGTFVAEEDKAEAEDEVVENEEI